jgi:uncharacterized protein (DUF58 family)
MGYSSHEVKKIDYARYLAASLAYLAGHQRDATGLIVFDDEIRHYVKPSGRQGQLPRLLHAINDAEPRARTNFSRPFHHFQEFLRRRGMVVVISDFYEDPAAVIRTVEPLRYRGNEVVMFHVLDPMEIEPVLKDPVILVDMETEDRMEVSPEFASNEYRNRMGAHLEQLDEKAQAAGLDYFLLSTNLPLDAALRQYLGVRQGRM